MCLANRTCELPACRPLVLHCSVPPGKTSKSKKYDDADGDGEDDSADGGDGDDASDGGDSDGMDGGDGGGNGAQRPRMLRIVCFQTQLTISCLKSADSESASCIALSQHVL